MDTLFKKGKINHSIPRNEPVKFEKKDIPLPPYSLGVLLGDGCLIDKVSLAAVDNEIISRVSKEMNCELVKYGSGRCRNESVIDGKKYEFLPLKNRWSHPVKNILSDLGLLHKKANHKFIPEIYKYSSVEDRIDLLRGLMDTDGTVKKNGEASFSTVSKQLALDVIELVNSLGGRAVLRKRNRIGSNHCLAGRAVISRNVCYEFNISLSNNINPFYIKRKSERFSSKYVHGVGIKSIESVGIKEVQCILVENPEHLYLTDGYMVTHNPYEEKVMPYMYPLFDAMKKLVPDSPQKDLVGTSVETAPVAYLRGRAQPLDAKIITPDGYKLMGDICVGDLVATMDGFTKVKNVHPQGKEEVYRVVFSDGSKTECCQDHLWLTKTLSEKRHNKDFSVKTLGQIIETIKISHNRKNHRVPTTKPIEHLYKETPMDPYLLSQVGRRQLIGTSAERQMNYAAFSAPGAAPQPAILVFYKWPNAGPISSDNAWEQAYAVASLAVKVCPVTLTTGGAIVIGGENGKYIGYEDGCGVQGELIGFVHNGMNFGMLIEAPKPLWEEWRPILRGVIGTLQFE